MLTVNQAKEKGLRACVDKLGYEFCKKHEDTVVYAYGEDNGVVECYVGVDDQPDKFNESGNTLILDGTRVSPYFVRCQVSLQDGTIVFIEFCTPNAKCL